MICRRFTVTDVGGFAGTVERIMGLPCLGGPEGQADVIWALIIISARRILVARACAD